MNLELRKMTNHAIKLESVNEIPELLEGLPLFKGLGPEIIQTLVEQSQSRNIRKGTILYLQDDPADWFYVILHGWVKLFRETIEGEEAVIDVLTNRHMFGENAVFEEDRYTYAVEIIEDSALIAMPTAVLKQQIATNNQLALNMLSSMSRHRLQQHREIEHLNVQNAPQRIGCFLLRLCGSKPEKHVTIHLPYDKTLIASRLGMKPETFSRALAKLKQNTNIKVSGPSVHIEDVDRLVEYTCNHCSTSFPCDDLK
ncbi:MAG: Crp/Fnr family transcriptional regulator [Rickettsiales bacterium]|nr:Crp/Fnr family transcriptional regulator [Rickettsiales bacterium]